MRRCYCGKDLDCELTTMLPMRDREWPFQDDVETEVCVECAGDIVGESLDLAYREVGQ
jgi:hypothetical protein